VSEESNTIIEQLETASETIENNDQKILEFEINKKEKSQVQENIDKEKKIEKEEEEKTIAEGEENYLFESLTKKEKKEIQEKRSQLLAEDEESFEEEEEKMKTQTKLEKRKARAQNRANRRKNRRSKTKKKKNNNPFGDLNFDHLMDKMKDFDFNNMKMPDNMDLNSMKDAAEQFGMDPKLLDNINMDKMKDFDFSKMKDFDFNKMKDFDFNNMKMPENMNSMKDMAKQFGMDPKLLDNINMDDVQNAMKNGFNKDDMKGAAPKIEL